MLAPLYLHWVTSAPTLSGALSWEQYSEDSSLFFIQMELEGSNKHHNNYTNLYAVRGHTQTSKELYLCLYLTRKAYHLCSSVFTKHLSFMTGFLFI